MADIDLSFGANLAPLLDNFSKLLEKASQTGEVVKRANATIQAEAKKSAIEVAKIDAAYRNTADAIAAIGANGITDFSLSIQKQTQDIEAGTQEIEQMQQAADKLVDSLFKGGVAGAKASADLQKAIVQESLALEQLIALRLESNDPTKDKQLNLEIAKRVNTVDALKKKLQELEATPVEDQTDGFKRLQVQIREAEKEAQRLGEQYGTLDERFITAAQKAANLREELSDVKAAIDAQNPEAKFKAFESVVGGVIGSLQTATGALQLFGAENERVQEIALRLQGLFNFAQGINTIFSLKDSFNNLLAVLGLTRTATIANTAATVAQGAAASGTAVAIAAEATATTAATTATNAFTAALLANPFTAIAVAITAIVGALYAYSEASDDAAENQKKINDDLESSIDILNRYATELDDFRKQRIAATQNELELAKSSNAPFVERIEIERRLAKQKLDAANASQGFYADEIENLDFTKARLTGLIERYESLKKSQEDPELLEQRKREIDLLQKQVDIVSGVKKAAEEAAIEYQKLNNEIAREDAERQLTNARGFIQARLAEARKGSSEELRARLDAIDLEQKAQIDALGFNEDLEGERLRIIAEANKKRIEAENEYLIARLEAQQTADRISLVRAQENSREELELRIKLLQDERDIELANLDLTERERLLIRLETEREISKLRREFALKEVEQSIELEKTNAALRLALAEKNSQDELQAKKDLITAEEELEIQRVNASVISEELKQQKITLIRTQAENERQELIRQSVKAELDLELELASTISQIRIDELNRQISAETTGSLTRRALLEDYYRELLDQIDREKSANIDAFNNGLISYEEFLKKKLELDAKYANTSADQQAAQTERRDIFEVLGLDLSDSEKQAANSAISGIFSNLKSGFDSYIQERQSQIDQIKAQNDELIASINQSIQDTQDAITQEVELAKLGYANNVEAKKAELEELKKQKQAALENDKKIAREQQKLQREKAIADALAQASSLAVAGAQVFASESSKGLVGVLTAISAITLLLSTFLRFKAQATTAATTLGEGDLIKLPGRRDSGLLKGPSHQHPSKGMRIEGTNIFVEGDEFVTKKRVTRKRLKLLRAINDEDFSGITFADVADIVKGAGLNVSQEMTTQIAREKQTINNYNQSMTIKAETEPLRKEMAGVREEIKALRADARKGKREVYSLPDGSVVEKNGNITSITRKA